MKINAASKGVSIVVAPKGAGKTELRRVLAYRAATDKDAVWEIDEDLTRTVQNPQRGAAQIKREISGLLLSGITAKLFADESLRTKIAKQWWDKAKEIFSRMGEVPQGVTIGPATLNLDVKALFRDTTTRFNEAPIEGYRELLGYLLLRRRCYMLIDDVDEVFEGAYAYPQIVEGLLRAAVDLNVTFRDRLHVIVFVKSGLYENYFRQARAHNEIRDHVGFLGWSEDSLVDLLAHRIGRKHGRADGDGTATERWQLEFSGSRKEVERIQAYLVERCNYGPRDLIMLANGAKVHADRRKVGLIDVVSTESDYCRDKLQLLVGDFGQSYQKIDTLIRQAFSGQKTEYEREEFETFVRTNIIQNSQFVDEEPFRHYVRFVNERHLIRLLFEMGFLGFRATVGEAYSYSMSHPSPGDFEEGATWYRIHPAYGKCLGLKDSLPSRR